MPLSEQRGEGVAIGVDLVNSWDELHREPELLSERWLRLLLARRVESPRQPLAELARPRQVAVGGVRVRVVPAVPREPAAEPALGEQLGLAMELVPRVDQVDADRDALAALLAQRHVALKVLIRLGLELLGGIRVASDQLPNGLEIGQIVAV